MTRWRIYYDDGSTYSSDRDPFFAPQTGVQVLVQEVPGGKIGFRPYHSKDAYYYRDGRWFACDEAGMWDYLLMHRGPKAVIFGRSMVRDEDFWKVVRRAKTEGLG